MQKLLLPLALAVLVFPISYAQTRSTDSAATSAAIASGQPIVEPSGTLTLRAALDLAARSNADISAAVREVQATEAAVQQAGIIRNPDISASIEDTRRETRTTTIQLNQPIELGGKRTARVSAAERGRDAAIMELNARKTQIRAAVVTAFYDLVAAQERYRLAQATVDLAQRATTIASKRVQAGKVSPVEETRARVAESGVRVELAQATGELDGARRRLAATWGSTMPRFDHAEDHLEKLPQLPALSDLAQRLDQSPELLRARIEVDRRQALTQVERSRRTPDVIVSIGAKRDEQLGRNQAIVGVSVPLPLFDRNQGNVLEALRRTDKARDELTATEVRLRSDLAQAYGRLNASLNEVTLLQKEVLPGAQSAYDATTKGFELGKFSFLEVLDAQRTFFQAKSQYLRALAETQRATAEIDRLVGTPFTAPSTNTPQQEKQ
ncbi:TolC family protein [Noviherbaspirillum galbum]|uniref:TolC family protein n=1 Tax=Noviherbaspirillum galbum TaxID=2709383 RepID=A0A6B3SS32_9BURK|nr:TolC family protein [Noviherbaspirillum galbum]NEX63318.1 TolC family protein [Noviherbaspirillum galbum]